MCLNFLFEKKYGITKPVNTKSLTGGELYSLLYSEFECHVIELSDREYKIAPFSEYVRFLKYDDTDELIYTSEFFDCDDFSVRLHGNITIPHWSALAFGELWVKKPTGGHAVNIFVDDEMEIWIVEPQTDKIFKMPDDWKAVRIEI